MIEEAKVNKIEEVKAKGASKGKVGYSLVVSPS